MLKNKLKTRQSGFTLIELIISMLIFSIISLIAYNALQAYTANQKLSFEHFEKISDLQKTGLFLKRDMNQLFKQNIRLEDSKLSIESLQNDKILDIEYSIENDNLVRKEVVNEFNISTLILLKNVMKFEFRLLNEKDKWLKKTDKKSGKIRALEVTFEHKYWGDIKQLVMIEK